MPFYACTTTILLICQYVSQPLAKMGKIHNDLYHVFETSLQFVTLAEVVSWGGLFSWFSLI